MEKTVRRISKKKITITKEGMGSEAIFRIYDGEHDSAVYKNSSRFMVNAFLFNEYGIIR